MSVLNQATNGLLTVLLAPRCAACEALLAAPLDGPVCAACWRNIVPITPPVCDACGVALPSWRVISLECARCPRCRRVPRSIDRSRAIGDYAGSLRAIIHALKYERRTSVAPRLAELMRARSDGLLDGADHLVPVPLHPRRQRARGFNQAELLARHLGLPVCPLLVRNRWTRPQVDLPEAQRHRNVLHAFGLAKGAAMRAGTVVVLVDDVCTTGATLEACARVLKEHTTVTEVRALTAARAPRRLP
jgi:ComF family protein